MNCKTKKPWVNVGRAPCSCTSWWWSLMSLSSFKYLCRSQTHLKPRARIRSHPGLVYSTKIGHLYLSECFALALIRIEAESACLEGLVMSVSRYKYSVFPPFARVWKKAQNGRYCSIKSYWAHNTFHGFIPEWEWSPTRLFVRRGAIAFLDCGLLR